MKKAEFLALLEKALIEKKIADREEIIEEYWQHFSYKLSDGYSEEEVSAKLGSPVVIAEQYDTSGPAQKPKCRMLTLTGLGVFDFFASIIYFVLICFGIAIAAFACCSLVGGICFISNTNIYGLIPNTPYHVAIIFGLTLTVLSLVSAIACTFYTALLKQLFRSYQRFHRNTVASAHNRSVLPSIPVTAPIPTKKRSVLRKILAVLVFTFAFLFVASFAVAVITAGDFEFWHIWGWFGYGA